MSPRNFEYEAAPTYESRYDDTIQDLIAGLLDRPDFSYDPATDPLYQNYRKQYTREGQRATADALGAAAAASGGIPSSYALSLIHIYARKRLPHQWGKLCVHRPRGGTGAGVRGTEEIGRASCRERV